MTDNSEDQTFSEPKPFKSDPKAAGLKKKALIAFGVLLAALMAVVLLLPAMLQKEAEPVVSQAQPEVVSAQDLAKVQEAEKLVQEILKHRAELENDGIQVWGKEKLKTSYGEVLALMDEADADMNEQRIGEALKKYRDVRDGLKQLEESRSQRFTLAMQAGHEAYKQLDGPSAVAHFEIAVAADPESTEAPSFLARAGQLPEILNLIQEGQSLEEGDEWEAARAKYSEALALDVEFVLAREHFERLDAAISERRFKQSMSDAAAALTRGDLLKSKAALKIASGLKPDSGDVNNLQQQLAIMEVRAAQQKLSRTALQYELDEEWEKARETYGQILKIDAKDRLALQSQKRAEDRLDMLRELQQYLAQPQRLQESEYRAHAKEIYALAASQEDAGPKLRGLNQNLKVLLDQYSSPVPVVMLSDGLTDVNIYHVRPFGSFKEERIELLPGVYKAVGTRSGYRDVSVSFTVPADGADVKVEVICKESI